MRSLAVLRFSCAYLQTVRDEELRVVLGDAVRVESRVGALQSDGVAGRTGRGVGADL